MDKTITVSEAVKLVVNCEENDPVDIRCGGPQYLGYDFYVRIEEKDETMDFIKGEIKKNKQPLLGISYVLMDFPKDDLWTKEGIAECIKKGY